MNSYATGEITLLSLPDPLIGGSAGGLIGKSYSLIKESYATGNIHSEQSNTSTVGGLVGQQINNDIIQSYATGNISGNIDSLGGLVGSLTFFQGNTKIYQSYATGNIDGKANVGGLIGHVGLEASYNNPNRDINSFATIEQSYATGNVSSYSNDLVPATGGLIASANGIIKIKNSFASGNVTGTQNVGGLLGILRNSFPSQQQVSLIENSYSNGLVVGTSFTGGLIGQIWSQTPTIVNSYWDADTSLQMTSAGGTRRYSADLTQIPFFEGWDIADVSDSNSTSVWVIDENNTTPWLRYNH